MIEYLDLGECKGQTYSIYSDWMLDNLSSSTGIVSALITDNYFMIGHNKKIEDYLKDDVDKSKFTFGSFYEAGGLMWCGNVCLVRVVFLSIEPNKYKEKIFSVIACMAGIFKTFSKEIIELKTNYLYLNGKKIAGFAARRKETRYSVHCCINLKNIPEEIKTLFKNKKFDTVGSLNNIISYSEFMNLFCSKFSKRCKMDVVEIGKPF